MMKSQALRVSGWIFLVTGLMHALRALLRVRVTIQDFAIPQNLSVVLAVVLIALAGWMFFSSK